MPPHPFSLRPAVARLPTMERRLGWVGLTLLLLTPQGEPKTSRVLHDTNGTVLLIYEIFILTMKCFVFLIFTSQIKPRARFSFIFPVSLTLFCSYASLSINVFFLFYFRFHIFPLTIFLCISLPFFPPYIKSHNLYIYFF